MKKLFAFFLMTVFVCSFTTACTNSKTQKANMIQSKRRFAAYMEGAELKNSNAIDLSDGPKLKYDRHIGPKNLEFDIKIIDPYKY